MDTKNYPYKVRIDWTMYVKWNELCADAVEKYGLPGSKYMVQPTQDYMDFYFKDEQDAIWFRLSSE